jgi:hypothetical protein
MIESCGFDPRVSSPLRLIESARQKSVGVPRNPLQSAGRPTGLSHLVSISCRC